MGGGVRNALVTGEEAGGAPAVHRCAVLIGDEPFRGELLSVDRLCDLARELGRAHAAATPRVRDVAPLTGVVDQAETALAGFVAAMSEAARTGRPVSASTEWLLDNSYLVDEQVRDIRQHLPQSYVTELARLPDGEARGYPRIFVAAAELLAHTDSRLDADYLERFVQAYQEAAPLSIGEVWAIPTMLRIALVENVRRLAAQVAATQAAETSADGWADRVLRALTEAPETLPAVAAELADDAFDAPPGFFVRLSRRLQGLDLDASAVTRWLDAQVLAYGAGLDALVVGEFQTQAANQVSIANSVTSIRFLTAFDWRVFFEDVNLTEQVLRRDPAGVYARMDFASRDRYRHAVEGLARNCPSSELEVAEAVVATSAEAMHGRPADTVVNHVGYYLIGPGRYEFEKLLGYEPIRRELLHRGPLCRRGLLYWGGVATLTAAAVALLGWHVQASGAGPAMTALLMLLSVVPFSDLALHLTNRAAAAAWPARVLPRLDSDAKVPDAHRTLVVVPMLATSQATVREVLDGVEVHYLSNADRNIHFAALIDLKAAPERETPEDAAIIESAVRRIELLNERYAGGESGPFHLFIRPRSLDERESRWVGRERKRGALEDLNRRLLGRAETDFLVELGDPRFLEGVVFVVTLDADTILPRDAAKRLIATIAHPLNRATFDPERRMVVRGYGLIQPRVSMSLRAARRSLLAWLYSSPVGIDPYAGAVSDTYQDVFGEGSYTGKGIYEVSVFYAALEGRIPENQLLSHDLLEGCFARVGLASDIEVFDDHPATYASHTARLHRWARGDWQTLPWLLPRVPSADGTRVPNPLAFLHRWKLFDNLRRGLFAPNMLILLTLGWLVMPGPDWVWSLVLLGILLFPVYMHLADSLLTHPSGVTLSSSLQSLSTDVGRDTLRAALTLACVPHQAYVMTDAAVRALFRQLVSRRRMLQWETAAEAEYGAGRTAGDYWRLMWPSVLLSVGMLMPTVVIAARQRLFAIPLVLVWFVAPMVAYGASTPLSRPEREPSSGERIFMRRVARRTWRFFERFVTAEDGWLVPDNFQEDPGGLVAHRTSPTNMGLQLLSCLTAYDLGYTCVPGLVQSVSRTLDTMLRLDRFHGHFFNWYDTRTLEPLPPGYVSTVDSGNLAGYLVALRVGLLEASEAPLLGGQVLAGTADTIRVALEDLAAENARVGPSPRLDEVHDQLDALLRRIAQEQPPENLGGWSRLARALTGAVEGVLERLDAAAEPSSEFARARESVADVVRAVEALQGLLTHLAPWAVLLEEPPRGLRDAECADLVSPLLHHVPSLRGLAEGLAAAVEALAVIPEELDGVADADGRAVAAWCARLAEGIEAGRSEAGGLFRKLGRCADAAQALWVGMDFAVLYDDAKNIFYIGYNTAAGAPDNSFYDLLASECRLASYVAVAKGDVHQEHWFRLGRALTRADGGYALVSWSASMFEYLMPLIVMRSWPDTLLGQTYRTVVRRQVQYGRQRGVPWGVSESAFNTKDVHLTYQYQAFGVPGLGLKRGLSEDVVVAPYATVLALPIDLGAGLANLARLEREGAAGDYGFYEAVDYTPGRVPAGRSRAVVKTYMAHHQGMTFTTIGNQLTGYRMRKRFHGDPVMDSAELLLQERVPRHVPTARPHPEEVRHVTSVEELPPPVNRTYVTADTPIPATHFLSNGTYSVMVTNGGGGYSRFRDVAVTRYREDVTRDCWGQFLFVRDRESGRVWSAANNPSITDPDQYEVIFSADKAEYRRRDGAVETHMEVLVSPEDDVEVRRVTLVNRGLEPLDLEVTSYFEISLVPQAADQAHRAFAKLFVETEAVDDLRALLFSRRPRSSAEPQLWGAHVVACETPVVHAWDYETDRARFLGRLNGLATARALTAEALSKTVGAVLDPVGSIRQGVQLAPGESARLAFSTGIAATRGQALRLAEKYADARNAQRAAELAWTAGQIELRDLGISPELAVLFERLASRMLLTDASSRLKMKTPIENGLPLSALWSLGVSGDHPILLVKLERSEEALLVRQALLAHQYWMHKGLVSDLVVLITKPSSYAGELEERLKFLVRTGHALQLVDKPGGVFLRQADHIHPDVLNLLETVARVTLSGERGSIAVQLDLRGKRPEPPEPLEPTMEPRALPSPEPARPALAFDNSYGGFDVDANEYVIVLEEGRVTPAPWMNVMAGPDFGSMVSEAGIGGTWAQNSHENRLTTWNNEPVSDGSGEMFYVRDEETGEFWSPTPLPAGGPGTYVVRHGRGYTRFEHAQRGIEHELLWFVPASDPVRVARLSLTNRSDTPRRLSVTHFVEWVLGDSRSKAQHRVVTWYDAEEHILTAHNHFNIDFPGLAAFVATDAKLHSFTGSRTEFLGRNGDPADPAALHRVGLGGETGRFLDNCGAIMTAVDLAPGETKRLTFLLGQAENLKQARALVARYRKPAVVERAYASVRGRWDKLLDAVRVKTPDRALDLMVNGWLLYQALSCRIWGRTALYQSGGAFGFRDQLQDTMAFALVRPELMREQIVEAARHQFREGDVLHWWMPPTGKGARTRISDDRLWLPYVVAEYLEATGDTSVLDVEVPYLDALPLAEDQEDSYLTPAVLERAGSVYEHCLAAIEASRGVGEQGLPLMGGGDWNDSMNRVGHEGQGESVWLAWFLDVVLRRFALVCELKDEPDRARELKTRAAELVAAVEEHAWDGAWYRRAFFDDGTPLGTREAEECRIDGVAQAWATISWSGDKGRARRAMESVEEHLVRWEDRLILLLTPPFDKMEQDPGYIKGYVPGVRENGGQYTHAALWVTLAHVLMGDGDEALSLLDLINPVKHASTPLEADVYMVEPYVIAADVYAVPPHTGRGGWTWYTGSAGWFYQVAVRYMLGLKTEADAGGRRFLVVDPCIPKSWPGYEIRYRFGQTTYEISVDNPRGVNRGVQDVALDGEPMEDLRIPLLDDGGTHAAVVTLLSGSDAPLPGRQEAPRR